ncbi:S1C family serine protease [Luteolibacter sp. SL250]|uniref:S1C family serine protease n=1 Tax=Luteolibacter sp. SL250 TaxID=2995170 RepID=UPI0022713814|nr:S1C family serine protease [Luteolibacter sp. SL250]WAC19481.1 S1C family serine protease [Luteolibacter sp. SL250]
MATPDGPVLVAVALQGADFSATSLVLGGKAVAARFIGYDAVSRLCVFKPSEPIREGILTWADKAPEQGGTRIGVGAGAVRRTGTLKGKVNRIGEKVLPFALLEAEAAGKNPEAGASVTSSDGKVIGIVFHPADDGGGVYVIPAQAVHRVVKDIMANGRLIRGWLGISLMVGNSEPRITKVWPGSPAADAGLREGDLINRIGNTDVGGYEDVADTFFYLIPGNPVEVTLTREGKAFRFSLTPTAARPN